MTGSPPGALAHVPLAPLTTLGIGGLARWLVRATQEADVASVHQWCVETGAPLFVLGGGSNIVVSDAGFDGVVLQIALTGATFTRASIGESVTAAAGEGWDDLVAAVVARGRSGIEYLSGIPGIVGGTPIQNVGAYGQQVADAIESVRVFDRCDGGFTDLAAHDCDFAYRTSRFKGIDAGRFIVCAVRFRLHERAQRSLYPEIERYLDEAGQRDPGMADIRSAVLAVRRRKGMVLDPSDVNTCSVGSFFVNPVVDAALRERMAFAAGARAPGFDLPNGQVKVPAAWLIERAGFTKGQADGAVAISAKHPLALVNRGGATARDLLRLAVRIKRQVGETFGVWLQPEPVFVGFAGDPDVDYLRRTDG